MKNTSLLNNKEFQKKHPIRFLFLLSLMLIGIGTMLTVLIVTAIIGIPLMMLGYIFLTISILAGFANGIKKIKTL